MGEGIALGTLGSIARWPSRSFRMLLRGARNGSPEREAEVLAALNHLNIAQILSLEESGISGSGSVRALVMELVPGENLAKCPQGPVPVGQNHLGRSMQPSPATALFPAPTLSLEHLREQFVVFQQPVCRAHPRLPGLETIGERNVLTFPSFLHFLSYGVPLRFRDNVMTSGQIQRRVDGILH
jgi:hypothetical protein